MIEIYDLLQKVKEKPGMYIGHPSVSNLFMFLCGYQHCLHELSIPESEQELEFREFQPWLQEKLKLSTSASWAKIILLYSSDDRDGFNKFFELLTEFLHRQKNSTDTTIDEKLASPA